MGRVDVRTARVHVRTGGVDVRTARVHVRTGGVTLRHVCAHVRIRRVTLRHGRCAALEAYRLDRVDRAPVRRPLKEISVPLCASVSLCEYERA